MYFGLKVSENPSNRKLVKRDLFFSPENQPSGRPLQALVRSGVSAILLDFPSCYHVCFWGRGAEEGEKAQLVKSVSFYKGSKSIQSHLQYTSTFILFFKFYKICLLIWERERERNINQLPPYCAPTRDQTYSLGMCPDWNLNLQPFGVWDDAPTIWAIWPRPYLLYWQEPTHQVSRAAGEVLDPVGRAFQSLGQDAARKKAVGKGV